jgi:hypothetical protein
MHLLAFLLEIANRHLGTEEIEAVTEIMRYNC